MIASAPAATLATARTASQRSRSPDITIMPMRTASSTSATPSAGSLMTRATSGAAHTTASATSRNSGRLPPSPSRLSIMAQISTRPSLANSDGSTWKPPGRLIHALAPFTELPSGVSTASRASSATP